VKREKEEGATVCRRHASVWSSTVAPCRPPTSLSSSTTWQRKRVKDERTKNDGGVALVVCHYIREASDWSPK